MRKKQIKNSEVAEVMRWFRRAVTYEGEPYTIDAEQVAAVVADDLNAIVVARAGSGKTRTIVAKMVYLIAKRGVKVEEMMAFVFNANAAKEINERLSKMCVNGESVVGEVDGSAVKSGSDGGRVRVARTFHAFARQVVYGASGGREKCGNILAGEREKYVLTMLMRMMKEEKWERKVRLFLKGVATDEEARIEEAEIIYLAKMMMLFINRAQQKYLGGEVKLKRVAKEYLKSEGVSVREQVFVELGVECFRRYHWYLLEAGLPGHKEYGTDFNLLVSWAGKLISGGKAREWLAGKKYILIDEYQDFSQLFLAVVMAIRRVVPGVRLFVVGDDWQAINRFAGSEVEYFREFSRYFPDGCRRYEITTNYRCDLEVVETARRFMRKALNEKGEFRAKSRRVGRVMLVDARPVKEWYLEVLARLVKENRKAKEILLLHRNNETSMKMSLVGLKTALKRAVLRAGVMSAEEFEAKVLVMTMHRSKGLEAEVVIILEADAGVIPKTHPDTRLYGMFGESEEVALQDQVRLFYVAMTRAKKRLYIMHDFGSNSGEGFIKWLGRGVERWEE